MCAFKVLRMETQCEETSRAPIDMSHKMSPPEPCKVAVAY